MAHPGGRPRVYEGPLASPKSVRLTPPEEAEVMDEIRASGLKQNQWLRQAAVEKARRDRRARERAAKKATPSA